ncbi:MAG: prepilin-type N-terminal cleavage/methylation domain-containing protein [Candidatus Omnitrophota bacterium]
MKRGFTLIEVLIVVILIGILATLLLPQISGMQERARLAEAKQVLGAMRAALMAYRMDEGTFPNAANIGLAAIEGTLGDIADDTRSLFDYSWPAGGNADRMFVNANRNGTWTGKQSHIYMVIEANGAADMNVSWT